MIFESLEIPKEDINKNKLLETGEDTQQTDR
jgi:hypothetical protein